MLYSLDLNYKKRKKVIRLLLAVSFIILVALMSFLGWIILENYRAGNYNSPEGTTTSVEQNHVAKSITDFHTPFFHFQASKRWVEDPSNSKNGEYSYRALKDGLLEHRLTVYVNKQPADVRVTNLLLAEKHNSSSLKSVEVSEHCGKEKAGATTAAYQGVSYSCFADDTRYSVLVATKDNGTTINLKRTDGSTASYIVSYTNLTATPSATEIKNIINSFQAR